MPAVVALVVGLLLGSICGGTLGNLKKPWLRFEGVVLVLFVAQGLARGRLVPWLPSASAGAGIWVGLCIALVFVLCASFNRPGVAVAITGLLMNITVVMLNFGMPVGGNVALDLPAVVSSDTGFYHGLSQSTIVPMMADVLPLQLGGTYLVSIGDVALSVAAITILISAMQPTAINLDE